MSAPIGDNGPGGAGCRLAGAVYHDQAQWRQNTQNERVTADTAAKREGPRVAAGKSKREG